MIKTMRSNPTRELTFNSGSYWSRFEFTTHSATHCFNSHPVSNRPASLLMVLAFLLVGCTGYDVERDGVYYKSWNEASGSSKRLLREADPAIFQVLDDARYGKDERRVYYQGE